MNTELMIDVRVPADAAHTKNSVLNQFEGEGTKVEVTTTRDFVTVITIAGSLVTLLKGIVELYEKLKKDPSMHEIKLEDENGNILSLKTSNLDLIEEFLKNAPKG